PLAMPAYVSGFVAVALLDYAGPLQQWLRTGLGYTGPLPPIRSWGGMVMTMSLVFYPYVYLLARAAFSERAVSLIEAARSLGQSPRSAFWRLSLPLARPAIAAGLALAAMEALGDFGTVAVFGYDAFTTAIYSVWFGMFDRVAAGQLALVLTGFTALLVWIEWRTRRGIRHATAVAGRGERVELRGRSGWFAAAVCGAVLMLALGLPIMVLAAWTVRAVRSGALAGNYPSLLGNTAVISLAAALLVVLAGLAVSLAPRLDGRRLSRVPGNLTLLGYAMPGSVIAVGVLLCFEQLEQGIAWAVESLTGNLPPLIILTSLAGLLFAYLVRFSAVSRQAIKAGVDRIPPELDEVARSLGAGAGRLVGRIHLPLLSRSLVAAGLLVSVEVLKEMPMTMLIRPFGFETLAVEVWLRTTEAMWVEAAPPALAIVLLGALLLGLLHMVTDPLT
ncbi:MAG TPA: iron ABC transporter permease, partial [Gemmatimonadales bacterium]|nr:iron ABC transporter permease [Gemmatimonadales bacterium]